MAGDAKFQLEDILNKVKPPPQILDLVNVKIESQEEFNALIEKIPDYKIKAETVRQQKCSYFLFLLQTWAAQFRLFIFHCY